MKYPSTGGFTNSSSKLHWSIQHEILQARILQWVAFPFSRGIFPTQESNPGLPHCRWVLYQLSHKGSPRILEWVAYPFSRGIFPTQLSNQGLHCRWILYQLSYQGSPTAATGRVKFFQHPPDSGRNGVVWEKGLRYVLCVKQPDNNYLRLGALQGLWCNYSNRAVVPKAVTHTL